MSDGFMSHQGPIGFPGGSDGKESACNAKVGSVPGSGRSPGGENGNSLQYSYLENSMDRGTWWATVHGVAELGTAERLTKESEMQYLDAISKTTE